MHRKWTGSDPEIDRKSNKHYQTLPNHEILPNTDIYRSFTPFNHSDLDQIFTNIYYYKYNVPLKIASHLHNFEILRFSEFLKIF